MINLSNTKYGTKRKAIIGGVQFHVLRQSMDVVFLVQLLSNADELLEDKSINQNRKVTYALSNDVRVDNQFNIIPSGGKGEYDYFLELMSTPPNTLPSLIIQLGNKLNSRGIFD